MCSHAANPDTMKMKRPYIHGFISLLVSASVLLAACGGVIEAPGAEQGWQAADALAAMQEEAAESVPVSTLLPPRPNYAPGELVDYIAQTGDTLPALAKRFNTTVQEILVANTFIPESATTMPPGMPMQIPIYYLPYWGSQYQILPDSLFVNGPAQIDFDTSAFVSGYPGWLGSHVEFASGVNRTGAQIVDLIARNYSVSPRLLLALLEHQSNALSSPGGPPLYPLGYENRQNRGLFMQLGWAANTLNNGYYGWRRGTLTEFVHTNGRIERPDPWQNAGTVALQYFFLQLQGQDAYNRSIAPEGFAATYQALFGDPWQEDVPHIPGSLVQPEMWLPFERGKTWAHTGGPHTAWGSGEPFAAIDFAPPAVAGGCLESDEWITAVAPGVVVRSEVGVVELDLEGDGDPRTGWTVYYLHVGTEGRVALGAVLEAGDPIGHPSCEGGRATGTHVHMARKYNGEWVLADGPLGFSLEGWTVQRGNLAYQGTMTRFSQRVVACECSNAESFIRAEWR